MGNNQGGNLNLGGAGGFGNLPNQKDKQDQKKKDQMPREKKSVPVRIGKKRKNKGVDTAAKLPTVTPVSKCRLRQLKVDRIKDYLLMEQEFIKNQEGQKPVTIEDVDGEEQDNVIFKRTFEQVGNIVYSKILKEERKKIEQLRGSPMLIGTLEEFIDEDHAIVSSIGPEYYTNILSFVDKDQLEPGSTVLLNNRNMAVVGIMQDEVDPLLNVMKVDKAPLESYADVGGLEQQITEIKEAVELPLTHPEIYEDMGIKPPKGVIMYGPPGTGKTLLAKAVANETSATFLRIVGSELIQKYAGEGPKLVRELFRVAEEHAPSIIFIDEIDAIGSKRYNTSSGGEKEIQRTMLELLNQLDGFDSRADVKVILATNKIESLDPALIRPGRIDRKIEFPVPDMKTKKKIFEIHTMKMSLGEEVKFDDFVHVKDDMNGADIKAMCTEAGLLALRERRMKITLDDFTKAKEKVLYLKKGDVPDGLYI